jgi:hypothetical protein
MAIEIIKDTIPSLDMTTQENLDLIARPLATVILANEIILESLFAETTIKGIFQSNRIPDIIKSGMLKTFARTNGIETVGESPTDIYSQIIFGLQNRNSNLSKQINSTINSTIDSNIDSLIIMDSTYKELERHKVSYVQLESSKAMYFTRSKLNNGTLLDGGYTRNDRLTYDAYINSEKITIPGTVDVAFSTQLIEEVVSIDIVDGFYHFPDGYFIDISPQADKQFAITINDKMVHGISKFAPVVFVEGGSPTEAFNVKRFIDPDFEANINHDEVEVLDILFKGKYPILIDFILYSNTTQDTALAVSTIEKYLISNSRDISLISPSEIMASLIKVGIKGVISSTNVAKLYFAVGKMEEQSITFPLSEKDFTIPDEIITSMVTARTVSAHVGTVSVVVE